jgi:glycosyltransferase involved in cell wall biosynthesis
MHICIFSLKGVSKNLPYWGGVNTHVQNLIRLLLGKSHKISLITSEGENLRDTSLRIIPIWGNQGGRPNKHWSNKAKKVFMDLHQESRVDCVFSEGDTVSGLMKLMKNYQISVVAFMHLLSMHYFYNLWQQVDGLRSFKSYVFRTLPRIVYDIIIKDISFMLKCRKVVTGSSAIAKELRRFYRIPAEKITVVNNWVEVDKFTRDEEARRESRIELGISNKDIVFLLVGGLWRPKGFRIAIRSFGHLIRRIPNSFMLISGEGPDRMFIENYIARFSELSGRVKLLGLISQEELPTLYSSADVFLIPSLMNEVLPYTLLEAMSCGLPIVATDIAANREALGPTGYFVPRRDVNSLTDAMFSLAEDPDKRRKFSTLARERVLSLFSEDIAEKKVSSLLEESLATAR